MDSDSVLDNNRDNNDCESVSGSIIGTKQYWDELYETELVNYNSFSDCGHIWFGLRNTNKIIEWIHQNICKSDSIVDIGCGNGYLLIELSKLGYESLCGVDYSSNAINLCQRLANTQNIKRIEFTVCNIIGDNNDINEWLSLTHKFDCIVDKGTFDAICLMPDIDISDVRLKYRNSILKLMSQNSVFILMSCNNTKQELCEYFMVDTIFSLIHEFESPKLSFGGCVGQQITGIVLKLLANQTSI